MHQHQQSHKAILSTICYADIFNFPLTKEEVIKYLINIPQNSFNADSVFSSLLKEGKIINQSGYYCIKGRGKIFEIRKKRKKISEEKIVKAKKISNILKYIPTIQLIGISGSLAMRNATEEDDIDFFIITKSKTLWLSRFIIVIFLKILGIKRERFAKNTKDRICVNMFLDESNLLLPRLKQNLYTAHEVMQMKFIFNRNNTYQKFLSVNAWVEKFLPNFNYQNTNSKTSRYYSNSFTRFISLAENFAKKVQLYYMKKYRTTELITDSLLAFHPKDRQGFVFREFQKRLVKYEI